MGTSADEAKGAPDYSWKSSRKYFLPSPPESLKTFIRCYLYVVACSDAWDGMWSFVGGTNHARPAGSDSDRKCNFLGKTPGLRISRVNRLIGGCNAHHRKCSSYFPLVQVPIVRRASFYVLVQTATTTLARSAFPKVLASPIRKAFASCWTTGPRRAIVRMAI